MKSSRDMNTVFGVLMIKREWPAKQQSMLELRSPRRCRTHRAQQGRGDGVWACPESRG